MNKVLYFAYGSNILQDRLNYRVGKNTFHSTYKLYGYKLVFNAVGWGRTAYANIIKGSKYDYVEGVLYELTSEQFKDLDRYEGLYERNYFIIPEIKEIGCTYICKVENIEDNYPSDEEYVKVIMEGCKHFGLFHTYAIAQERLKQSVKVGKGSVKSTKRGNRTTFKVGMGWPW